MWHRYRWVLLAVFLATRAVLFSSPRSTWWVVRGPNFDPRLSLELEELARKEGAAVKYTEAAKSARAGGLALVFEQPESPVAVVNDLKLHSEGQRPSESTLLISAGGRLGFGLRLPPPPGSITRFAASPNSCGFPQRGPHTRSRPQPRASRRPSGVMKFEWRTFRRFQSAALWKGFTGNRGPMTSAWP